LAAPICIKSLGICYGRFQELLEEWEQWQQPTINQMMQGYMHCRSCFRVAGVDIFSFLLSPAGVHTFCIGGKWSLRGASGAAGLGAVGALQPCFSVMRRCWPTDKRQNRQPSTTALHSLSPNHRPASRPTGSAGWRIACTQNILHRHSTPHSSASTGYAALPAMGVCLSCLGLDGKGSPASEVRRELEARSRATVKANRPSEL